MVLNPLLKETQAPSAQVQSYSVERPTSPAKAKIYQKIIDACAENELSADTALRIAYAESHFRQYDETTGDVLRGKQNSLDVGIFQINEKYHLERSQALGLDIHEPDDNIEYAMWLMKKEGTKPWVWSRPNWSGENVLKN